MAKEKVLIQLGEEVIEIKGQELDAFIKDKEEIKAHHEELKNELKAQKELKISAYKKLGLTDEEIAAII